MSYVLDALKKSEQERRALHQPSRQPAFSSMSALQTRNYRLPLIFVVVTISMAWAIKQWQESDNGMNVEVQASLGLARADVEVKKKIKPAIAPQSIQQQPVFNSVPQEGAAAPNNNTALIHVEEKTSPFTLVTPEYPLNGDTSSSGASEHVTASTGREELHTLLRDVKDSIPTIKIEAHIYDVDPHARIVIINGKVRKEKQTVGSGIRIQEITKDGVVINYQGRLFHIGVFD